MTNKSADWPCLGAELEGKLTGNPSLSYGFHHTLWGVLQVFRKKTAILGSSICLKNRVLQNHSFLIQLFLAMISSLSLLKSLKMTSRHFGHMPKYGGFVRWGESQVIIIGFNTENGHP